MYEILGKHMKDIEALAIIKVIKADLHQFADNFQKETFTIQEYDFMFKVLNKKEKEERFQLIYDHFDVKQNPI